ncbi:transforming growth factor-beta-induced protein ig-h3-like [Elysia marginata]|uniref:Transforming growth factor-beta-induced protein ig-h3-like n=1 Tax=Elysia marginata TaxID=1093978 RepID=A0AAV4EYY3_9GAST|nr:transforming growth factor-beta-induced protein ig-h3-like [Elysia marginata]
MKVLLCVTYSLALVLGFSQENYALDTEFTGNSNLLFDQEDIKHTQNLAVDQDRTSIAQDDQALHMQIVDLLDDEDRNVTRAIPEKAARLGLTILSNDISRAKLRDALEAKGPFTLFGPTNQAFRAMPDLAKEALKDSRVLAKYLKFHVVKDELRSGQLNNDDLAETLLGTKLRVNIYKHGKNVIATAQCAPIDLARVDNNATNGVIHVLNGVIIPPDGNAVTALAGHREFGTLVKAVQAAGLVPKLSGDGPFTVFAPTNDAFGKLPPGTLHKLLKNPVELAKILKYHVVAGTYCSRGIVSGEVTTVEGQDVKIKVTADGVTVNNAKVIQADLSITNGVVHGIDTVLLPPVFYL